MGLDLRKLEEIFFIYMGYAHGKEKKKRKFCLPSQALKMAFKSKKKEIEKAKVVVSGGGSLWWWCKMIKLRGRWCEWIGGGWW